MDEIRILAESRALCRHRRRGDRRHAALPYLRAAASIAPGKRMLRAGELALEVGLVLEGSVRVERVDAWGGRFILERFGPGEAFAEAYACVEGEPLLVDVVAADGLRQRSFWTRRACCASGPTA